MTEKIEQIKVEFSEASLWGYSDQSEWDVDQSNKNYAEMLEAELSEQYPDIDITVHASINDQVTVDGMRDHAEIAYIENAINRVWESYDWMAA